MTADTRTQAAPLCSLHGLGTLALPEPLEKRSKTLEDPVSMFAGL